MTEETPNKKNSKKGLIIAFIAILLIINGIQLYLNLSKNKAIEEKDNSIEEKSIELSKTTNELDSLNVALKAKIAEVQQLGGDTASLGAIRRELLKDLNSAQAAQATDKRKIKQLKRKVEEYTVLLLQKDEEIAKLKDERDQLFNVNSKLKHTIVAKEDSLYLLKESKKVLSDKVSAASVLQAQSIKVTIIDQRGNEKEDDEYKSKKIDKLKVAFTIAENKVAKIETKEVYLRLVEPEGSTLFDMSTGGGSFKVGNKELPYTAKQSFLFDNKQPRLTFVWGKGSPLKPGNYTVELFAEGHKIGQDNFTVK